MEESEVDDWFNEQKEMLEERFAAESQKDLYKAKDRFDKDYKRLLLEFQKRHGKVYDQKLRQARMQKPIARFRERKRLLVESTDLWFTERKLAIKKWFFDQRVKRILKDKRDL
jgi:CRISPR/Cas system CMR subunit Cmr6 (Cas7 group RAMP superfamily)